ncbi:hypothetical protein HD554DRAFT_2117277 [Boletus coccyginus]|nr:hypothetical protein HD554DRAFT_2117277 [Boletus coccyginus]
MWCGVLYLHLVLLHLSRNNGLREAHQSPYGVPLSSGKRLLSRWDLAGSESCDREWCEVSSQVRFVTKFKCPSA